MMDSFGETRGERLNQEALSHYEVASQYLNEGRLDEAVSELKKVLLVHPGHVQAHYDLATALYRQDKVEAAIKEWQEALVIMPNFVRAHYNIGLAYKRLGLTDKAVAELQVALQIVSNQDDATGERRIQRELVRLQGVESYLEKIEHNPHDVDALQKLGEVYFRQGKFKDALEQFLKVRELAPHQANPHFWVAQCHYKLNDEEAAQQACEIALRRDPAMPRAYFLLAKILTHKGELDKAVETYRKAIKFDPEDPYYLYSLGRVFVRLKQWNDAIEAYQQAIYLDPHDPYTRNNLGRVYLELDRYDMAIQEFYRAIDLDPNDAQVYLNLGEVFSFLGELSKAKNYFSKAVSLESKSFKTHLSLAQVLVRMGSYGLAIDSFLRAVELEPEHVNARVELGRCYLRLHQTTEAEESFQEVLKLDPSSAKGLEGIGEVYKRLGKWELAIQSFEAAVQQAEFPAPLYYRLGQMLDKNEQLSEAASCYEKALVHHPQFSAAYLALSKVQKKMDNLDGALYYALSAIEFDPNVAYYYFEVAKLYLAFEPAEQKLASQYFSKVIQFEPYWGYARYLLALSLRAVNEDVKAKNHLRRAVELEPERAEYWFELGLIERDTGFHEEAGKAFAQATSLEAKLEYFLEQADLAFFQKDWLLASELYQRCLEFSDDYESLSEVYYELGLSFYHLKQMDAAEESFKLCIECDPKHLESYFYLGKIFFQKGALEEALDNLAQAIELDENFSESYYLMAKVLMDGGQIHLAKNAILSALDKSDQLMSGLGDVYYDLGVVSQAMGDHTQASMAYDKALEYGCMEQEIYQRKSKVLHQMGDFSQSEQELAVAQAMRDDTSAELYYQAARLYYAQDKYELALQEIKQALEHYPEMVHLEKFKALCLAKVNPPEEGFILLQNILELHGPDSQVYKALAQLFEESHRYELAVENYEKAWSLEPENLDCLYRLIPLLLERKDPKPVVHHLSQLKGLERHPLLYSYLGEAYGLLKSWTRANQCFERALRLEPGLAEAKAGLGQVLLRRGRFEEALTYFQEASLLRPQWARPYAEQGLIYMQKGQWSEAAKVLTEAANIEESAEHYSRLGLILFRLNRFEDATEVLSRAVELDPESAENHSHLGVAYIGSNQIEKAIVAYKKSISLDASQPKTHYNLGVAYSKLKQWDRVITCYRTALALDSQDLPARFNLALILERMELKEEAIGQLQEAYRIAHRKQVTQYREKALQELKRLGVEEPTL